MISVIVCTRDRAAALRQSLERLQQLRLPPGQAAECLVVDNGSRDDTVQAARDGWHAAWPLRLVSEPQPGQARARNTGLRHAAGEVIAFCDDDVHVEPSWLEQLCEPLLAGTADATAGNIRLPGERVRPWMDAHLRALFCSAERMTDPPDQLVGASMAFHRRVLERVPRFDQNLGPGASGFFDDTLFSRQLIAAGYRLKFVETALGVHVFDASRLSRAALKVLARRHAQSQAYVDYHWAHAAIRHGRLRTWRASLRLLTWLARHPLTTRCDGMAPEEFRRRHLLHYRQEFLALRATPRRYARHGLEAPQ
ncbi:MAG TPA: glycosyltransferase family 2 protein [Candidatus Binatia bacterium]|nr:glycosyltransferase family 2 protein [Candidatus Binatia bacterium]